MESEECKGCPLYEHRTGHRLPDGTTAAWQLHSRLGGAGVQRYGLQGLVLQTFAGELDQEEAMTLFDQVDAIVEGLEEAGQLIADRSRPQARKR